jgi:hypothetical protein
MISDTSRATQMRIELRDIATDPAPDPASSK